MFDQTSRSGIFRKSRSVGKMTAAIAAAVAGIPAVASMAATQNWTATASTADWGTASNWNNGAGPVPGASDIAFFNGTSTSIVGLSSTYSFGAITLGADQTTGITFGNSSTATGTYKWSLAGATVNGNSNVILSNYTTTPTTLTIQNDVGSGVGSPSLYLTTPAGTSNVFQAAAGDTLAVNIPITSVNAGTINVSSGTLSLGAGSSLTSNQSIFLSNTTGANLVINGAAIATSSITGGGSAGGNLNLASGSLTVNSGSGTNIFSGIISGAGQFTKTNNATVELTGANTFTGNLVLSGGGLIPSGNSVLSGNTLVSGPFGAGTLAISGGTLAAPYATVGSQTIYNAISLNGTFQLGNYQTGDNLTLNGPISVNAPLTIAARGGGTTGVPQGAYTLNGAISGAAGNGLTITYGEAPIFFAGSNTFAGGINLSGGLLIPNAPSTFNSAGGLISGPFGTGTITLNSGTIDAPAKYSISSANTVIANPIVFNGSFALGVTSDLSNLTFTGPVSINAPSTVSSVGGGTFTFNGNITGGSGNTLNVSGGSASIVLAGTNTYSGPTNITAGSGIGHGVIIAGSTTGLSPNSDFNLSGSNAVIQLAGYNNSIGSLAGTTGTIEDDSNTSAILTLGGDGKSTSYAGAINDSFYQSGVTGKLGITKIGAGTFTLAYNESNNSGYAYSGPTNVSAGTLALGITGATSPNSQMFIGSNGMVDLKGFNAAMGSLAGSGPLVNSGASGVTLTIGGDNSIANYTGNIGNGSPINLSLIKTGTGTQTLSGNNAYTGSTNVSKGELAITTANSLGSGTITVSGGTLDISAGLTFSSPITWGSTGGIGGTGTYAPGSPLLVGSASNPSFISPGISDGTNNAGTLTINNSVTFAASKVTLNLDINGASADQLNVVGAASLAGTEVNLNTLSAPTAGSYTLLNASGGVTGSFGYFNPGLPADYRVLYTANTVTLTHQASIGAIVAVSPTTVVTGASVPVVLSVTNAAPVNSSNLAFTIAATGGNLTGTATGTAVAPSAANSSSGLTFSTSTVGLNQIGTFNVSGAQGATAGGPISGSISINVLDHAHPGIDASGDTAYPTTITLPPLTVGASAQTSNVSIYNILGSDPTAQAGLSVLGYNTSGSGFSLTGLPTSAVPAGSSSPIYASLASTATPGNYSETFTLHTSDDTSLPGATGLSNLVFTVNETVVQAGPSNLIWSNSAGTGAWNTTDTNWTNGTGSISYSDTSNTTTGDIVTFNDNNGGAGNYNVTLAASVSPTLITFNNNTGNYNLSGAGGISGTTSLTKYGTGTVTLSTSNNYSGGTFVYAGTLVLASPGAFPTNTTLNVSSGATVQIANHSTASSYVPTISTLSNSGSIDLTNNAMVVHNGSLTAINAEVTNAYNGGAWNGTNSSSGVITSSWAASDTTHLTAVGVATGLTSFQGSPISATDVLVKYTYYGDTNLDGEVDGSDYSRIDNGYVLGLTGWQNGDFNYDGAVDGSDYTLMDNAFNTQGAAIASQLASPTAQIAGLSTTSAITSAVPEPASLGVLGIGVFGLLGRRRRTHSQT
jgi:autotransporter-associated beta strand protein